MNEALVGATSTDVLQALSADMCDLNLGINRIPRLAGHLLEQHSFYPLFPAPDKIHPQVYSMFTFSIRFYLVLPSTVGSTSVEALDYEVYPRYFTCPFPAKYFCERNSWILGDKSRFIG